MTEYVRKDGEYGSTVERIQAPSMSSIVADHLEALDEAEYVIAFLRSGNDATSPPTQYKMDAGMLIRALRVYGMYVSLPISKPGSCDSYERS
jgi:hypothetical protein